MGGGGWWWFWVIHIKGCTDTHFFITDAPMVSIVSVDVAVVKQASEESSFGYQYDFLGLTKRARDRVLNVLHHLKVPIRTNHQHARLFVFPNELSGWQPNYIALEPSEALSQDDIAACQYNENLISKYSLSDVKLDICLQATCTEKNDFYTIPKHLIHYLTLLLYQEEHITSTDKFIRLMIRTDIPTDVVQTAENMVDDGHDDMETLTQEFSLMEIK